MKKTRVAIVTTYMDRRPAMGTAIAIRGLLTRMKLYRQEFDVTGRVHIKILEDRDMPKVYNAAEMLVFPSL